MPKPTSVTVAVRVSQYPKGTFHVDDGIMFCSRCNVSIDWTKKDTCDDHLKGKRHLKKVSSENATNTTLSEPSTKKVCLQSSIDGCFKRQNNSASARQHVIFDLVNAFTSANIPAEKLNNPALRDFFEKHVKNGGSIATAEQVRQKYIPELYEIKVRDIKREFHDNYVAVFVDETTDCRQRYVLNILFKKLDACNSKSPKLVSTIFLKEANHRTVSQAILKTIAEYEVNFDNILCYV